MQLKPWQLVVPPPPRACILPVISASEDIFLPISVVHEDDESEDMKMPTKARKSFGPLSSNRSPVVVTPAANEADIKDERGTIVNFDKMSLDNHADYPGPITLTSFNHTTFDNSSQPVKQSSRPAPHPSLPPTPTSAAHLLSFSRTPQTPEFSHVYPPSLTSGAVYQAEKSRFTLKEFTDFSTRTKIYGPEVPVSDPRIRAAHKQVLKDMLFAGLIWGVTWMVIVLCLPYGAGR